MCVQQYRIVQASLDWSFESTATTAVSLSEARERQIDLFGEVICIYLACGSVERWVGGLEYCCTE